MLKHPLAQKVISRIHVDKLKSDYRPNPTEIPARKGLASGLVFHDQFFVMKSNIC